MNLNDLQEELFTLHQMRKNGSISEEEYSSRVETIKAGLEKERAKQTTYFFRSSINQNEKIKLKPCPFCGYDYATFEHGKEGFVYVQCHKSGCMTRTDGCLNEEEAARLWNRRDYKGGSIG